MPSTSDVPDAPTRRSVARQVLHAAVVATTLLLVAAASITFALRVTPEQSVTALGQTVAVGTASPTWSTSGPGEIVLFGRSLPTEVDFVGPVRPRLVLTDISINEQLASLFTPGGEGSGASVLGDALAGGWRRYFAWEIVFVAFGALLLLGAIAGWRRYGWKRTLATLLGGIAFAEAINLGAIMLTAYTAPDVLRQVHSVSELVGREPPQPVVAAGGPAMPGVQAIVMGDSTAAGLGGPPLRHPSALDEACQRSSSAFALTLGRVNGWRVDNLGCSGATVADGVMGPQITGGQRIPSQLAVAERAVDAKVVVISVGANDLHWSVLVRLCAVSDACDDRALTAYFQRSLNGFTQDYFEMLRQLAALPGHPRILINQYYVPFDPALDCLASSGLTAAKIRVLLDRLDALNTVIANGADTFGYRTVQPDFRGHELCTPQSYVQGLDDPAPFHPNARRQLVIALADERALLGAR